jgi:hypothetical protein
MDKDALVATAMAKAMVIDAEEAVVTMSMDEEDVVSGGCVLVGGWVGPHHFHCLLFR